MLRDQEKDQELRGVFRDLQRDDRHRTPDFTKLMARAREEASRSGMETPSRSMGGHQIPRKLAWGGSLLAAAAAAVLLMVQIQGTSDSEFVQVVQGFSTNPASGAWKSPTDALLDLPGREILSTVPSITSRLLLDPRPDPQRNEL